MALKEYMEKKEWTTRQKILHILEKGFQQGYIGFHICPQYICQETDTIIEYICDLFEIPPTSEFFHVVPCDCQKMALFVDPSIIRKYSNFLTVQYCMDP
jgi:hypothetical protein